MAQQVDFSIPRHFLIIRQMIATRHVINDMTLSFPCRMFALFSLQVLLNGTMFERLRNAFVLPWRCDDETYSNDIKDGFKWKASYGEDEETMNAHFDFWYRQIFLNPMVEFRYTDVYGVAGFAKIVGPLYSFTHQLHGFLEYVDEATFHRLQELRHWSLFSYYDSSSPSKIKPNLGGKSALIFNAVKYPTRRKFFRRVFSQHGLMLIYFLIIGLLTQERGAS